MTNLTYQTNKTLTDLLKVVLPEYEVKSGLYYDYSANIYFGDSLPKLRYGDRTWHDGATISGEFCPLITPLTLIDLLSGDKPKILNQRNPWYTSKSEIQVFPDIRVDGQEMTLATLLGIIGIDPPPKTIAQFFLREDIESGRVLTDFEGVCLELIESIKTNYNL
jgi:hypothetical protein